MLVLVRVRVAFSEHREWKPVGSRNLRSFMISTIVDAWHHFQKTVLRLFDACG